MSDIKKALTEEIRRLAKKEIKRATAPLVARIVELRKKVSELSKALNSPCKIRETACAEPSALPERRLRLNAKGIKRIRARFGMTQAEFAKTLGVGLPALRTWEQGRCKPNGKAKAKIAELRKTNPSKLKKETPPA